MVATRLKFNPVLTLQTLLPVPLLHPLQDFLIAKLAPHPRHMGLLTSHTGPAQATHAVSHICARGFCVGTEIPRARRVGAVRPVRIIMVSHFLVKLPFDVRLRIEDGL